MGAGKESAPELLHYTRSCGNTRTRHRQDLGFLGKGAYVDNSEAYGINDLGHVVGNSALGTAIRGFLWRNGSMMDLGCVERSGSKAQPMRLTTQVSSVGKSNLYPVTWKYDIANSSSTPVIQQLPIPSGFLRRPADRGE